MALVIHIIPSEAQTMPGVSTGVSSKGKAKLNDEKSVLSDFKTVLSSLSVVCFDF